MKVTIYLATDAVDHLVSLFAFNEDFSEYNVISYRDEEDLCVLLSHIIKNGLSWSDRRNNAPRKHDMINPVVVCEVNTLNARAINTRC